MSCQGTRQKFGMPSVRSGHSAKSDFAECPDLALGELSFSEMSSTTPLHVGASELVRRQGRVLGNDGGHVA